MEAVRGNTGLPSVSQAYQQYMYPPFRLTNSAFGVTSPLRDSARGVPERDHVTRPGEMLWTRSTCQKPGCVRAIMCRDTRGDRMRRI